MPWKQSIIFVAACSWFVIAARPSSVAAGEDCQIEQPGIPPCQGCNPEQCCVCYAVGAPDHNCELCGGGPGWKEGTWEYECGGSACWWNPPNVFQERECGFC